MITFFQWLVVLASGYQVSEALFNNNQLGDKIFNWGGSSLGEQGDGLDFIRSESHGSGFRVCVHGGFKTVWLFC